MKYTASKIIIIYFIVCIMFTIIMLFIDKDWSCLIILILISYCASKCLYSITIHNDHISVVSARGRKIHLKNDLLDYRRHGFTPVEIISLQFKNIKYNFFAPVFIDRFSKEIKYFIKKTSRNID